MGENIIYIMLLSLLVAMLVVMVVHPFLTKIARHKHIVDNPNARKLNKEPVPILGGVGVVCGILFGMGVAGCCNLPQDMCAEIVIGLVVMLYTGVGDDILDLSPRQKVSLQIFVLCMMIFSAEIYVDNLHGVWGIDYLPYPLSMCLTLLAGVGIINAINLIDGVDGLCALYVMMASLFLGLFLLYIGDVVFAVMAFATLGALLPFALHNMYGTKYKMFLGDGGSLALGFIAAILALRTVQLGHEGMELNVVAFAFAVLSVPVCDTLRVMAVRLLHRQSPFMPDKRHLHHVFIALGFSHRATAFAVSALGAMIVMVWLLSAIGGTSVDKQLLFILIVATSLVWGLYYAMLYILRHNTVLATTLRRVVHRYSLRRKEIVRKLERVLNDEY